MAEGIDPDISDISFKDKSLVQGFSATKPDDDDKASVKSQASRTSRASRTSKGSSVSEKIKRANKLAELEIRQKLIREKLEFEKSAQLEEQRKRERELERERERERERMADKQCQLEIEQQRQLLEMNGELELAKFRFENDVYSEDEYNDDADDDVNVTNKDKNLSDSNTSPDRRLVDPIVKEETKFQVRNSSGNRNRDQDNTMAAVNRAITHLAEIATQNSLPKLELSTFSGQPAKFHQWLTAFEQLIEGTTHDPTKRIQYLQQFTSGEAKSLISGYFVNYNEDSYFEAKRELIKEYGNPVVVAREYLNKIRSYKSISINDSQGLRDFSIFLKSCRGSMATIDHLSQLNTDLYLQRVVSKLAVPLQAKWRSQVCLHEAQGRSIDFYKLVDFVDTLAKEANHPVFGATALGAAGLHGSMGVSNTSNSHQKKNHTVASTVVKHNDESEKSSTNQRFFKPSVCVKCNRNHSLDSCREFNDMSISERRKFVRDARLCFACLKHTSKEHYAKTCKNRKKCSVCQNRHPSSLHDNNYKPAAASKNNEDTANTTVKSAACTTNNNHDVLLNVLQVKVKYGDREVITYAALDSMSSCCLVSKDLWRQFNCPGRQTTINMKTVNSEGDYKLTAVEDFKVISLSSQQEITLPTVYVQDKLPIESSDVVSHEILEKYSHLRHLVKEIPPRDDSVKIGLLIGVDCSKALEPIEIIRAQNNGPYAIRTVLGWTVAGRCGVKKGNVKNSVTCNLITVSEAQISDMWQKMYEQDFVESSIKPLLRCNTNDADEIRSKLVSYNDRKFLTLMQDNVKKVNGHYELPLPLTDAKPSVNNRAQAESRLKGLKRKLDHDSAYKAAYSQFINDMLVKGYAKKSTGTANGLWYIPHHGVYHPRKPNKLRVVFDCSAQCMGNSLNQSLLSGPDLTNSLVGVLLRFRQENIAVIADIEAMFYQVKVPEVQQDYLRFLWYPEGDTSKQPEEYQMTVHLFGATSSPSCANFALRQTANDNASVFGVEARNTLINNFYVDDMLKSVKDEKTAIELVDSVRNMCTEGGFHLNKFMSNNPDILKFVPIQDQADKTANQHVDLVSVSPQVEMALGVCWCIENDCLGFRIQLKDSPLTRRGMLSTVSSVYDPLGYAAPFLLEGKLLLQELCQRNAGWDDLVDGDIRSRWEKWRRNLHLLENIQLKRCYKPAEFGKIISASLHSFADSSQKAYGCCSYLRLVDETGKIHCSLVIGKSRVAPIKPITIPRLELVAATVAVKLDKLLRQELEYEQLQSWYWTDSKAVLGYIANDAKRFHTFVANRVQFIRENSEVKFWNFVATKVNPADDASRGIPCSKIANDHQWFKGPPMLWEPSECWKNKSELITVPVNDVEMKKVKLVAAATSVGSPRTTDALDKWLSHFSCWYKMKKSFAWLCVVMRQLRSVVNKKPLRNLRNRLSIQELSQAEIVLLKYVQSQGFPGELASLQHDHSVKKSSPVYRLSPIINLDGLLCVGGRLHHLHHDEFSFKKHPIILQKNHHVTEIIVRDFHIKSAHSGKEFVMSKIREKFWILGARGLIYRVRSECFTCKKLFDKPMNQRMADLPADRLEAGSPPFSKVGIDLFGPFLIKHGRSEVKRYGCVFTCLATRAVHLEIVHSLETDSFINALQRFLSRRGKPSTIRSDNGSNFVGAERELNAALKEWNNGKTQEFMRQNQIEWKFNPPTASHMGGVWERQIRTIRKILSALMNGQLLTDESLATLMCIIENIINSRPITPVSDDPEDLEALTPNHLLQPRNEVRLPPGNFQKQDIYRKRWRQVQYLADVFWKRWKSEYLPTLQARLKWLKPQRNLQCGDLVLIKDDNMPRCEWLMGRVSKINFGSDGLVRSGEIKTRTGSFLRPIHKLCLLEGYADAD